MRRRKDSLFKSAGRGELRMLSVENVECAISLTRFKLIAKI
jgi:hypothetical protein